MDAQKKKYLTKEQQFLRKLIVCMHVIGRYSIQKAIRLVIEINNGCHRWLASAGP